MPGNMLISLTGEEGPESEFGVPEAHVFTALFTWPEPSDGWQPTWHLIPTASVADS